MQTYPKYPDNQFKVSLIINITLSKNVRAIEKCFLQVSQVASTKILVDVVLQVISYRQIEYLS